MIRWGLFLIIPWQIKQIKYLYLFPSVGWLLYTEALKIKSKEITVPVAESTICWILKKKECTEQLNNNNNCHSSIFISIFVWVLFLSSGFFISVEFSLFFLIEYWSSIRVGQAFCWKYFLSITAIIYHKSHVVVVYFVVCCCLFFPGHEEDLQSLCEVSRVEAET